MSLLLRDEELDARTAIADGPLKPVAEGLTKELAPLFDRDLYMPREKALLSREGGRCAREGATLEFDPFSPHQHRCPVCGEIYTGVFHDRFWIFWYQLWLAERALHGALLARLHRNSDAEALAAEILERYCDQYLRYPNRDNVLGPTRPFFSTYLESIWLLNLCIAIELLEKASAKHASLGARVRERVIEPSAVLVASYDEGASNRQVWNDAALIAANRLLGRDDRVERALLHGSGIVYHLSHGLLADGTWYEGENYHLFAHRGLWYAVTMAEAAGAALPNELMARFQEGFATPFLTALPDMTLPSRRDSQYKISLRQPRFAELAELGLARQAGDGDPRLRGVLHRLYGDDVPRQNTGRDRTTADVERNLPATALSRADLGWRSLLFARPELPPLRAEPLGTVLLNEQGVAVFRRAAERVYVALDYGQSGGGHGHPDRLNVLLSDGPTRWLDDMGTGSYVDPSLHWYRSTLAHNAPLFNGYEQQRIDGELLGFDERGEAGWVSARALDLFPGVAAMRSLVVMSDYALDELLWYSENPVVMDLPIHLAPATITIRRSSRERRGSLVDLADTLEDTLGVLRDASSDWLGANSVARVVARDGECVLNGCIMPSFGSLLYRVTAPGPPGADPRPMLLLRLASPGGRQWVRIAWSWSDAVDNIATDTTGAHTFVQRRDGGVDRHHHIVGGWRIERTAGGLQRAIALFGVARHERTQSVVEAAPSETVPASVLMPGVPLVFELGEADYRQSEESWEEAGRPRARVGVLAAPNEIVVDVAVRKSGALTFVPADAKNPYDNEAPDINGDGIQLYFVDDLGASGFVLVPEPDEEGQRNVRARIIESWDTVRALRAGCQLTADGYSIRVRVPFPAGDFSPREFALGVVVNEKPPERDRRRGQLVLGGAAGEFVYLRGDREDRTRLPRFRLVR